MPIYIDEFKAHYDPDAGAWDQEWYGMIFDGLGRDENGDFSGTYLPGVYFDFGNAVFN